MHRALIICNSIYSKDPVALPALTGPAVDGMHMWRALTDPDYGLFEVGNVAVLMERNSHEILMAAEEFFKGTRAGDLALFYYSGHGKRDDARDLVLCGRETTTAALLSTGVSAGILSRMIDSAKAAVVVIILDCCHSGAFKGDDLAEKLAGSGRYVLAASRATELAIDSEDKAKASPFTRTLVLGLTGKSRDRDGDNRVDVEDLFDYVSEHRRRTDPTPQRKFDSSGRAPLAKHRPEVSSSEAFDGEEDLALLPTHRGDPVSADVAEPGAPSLGPRLATARGRTGGDYSLGDVNGWSFYFAVGLVVVIASIFAFLDWPSESTAPGLNARDIAQFSGAAGFILMAVSALECFLLARLLPSCFARRDYQRLTHSGILGRLRNIRNGVAIAVAVVLVLWPLTGLYNMTAPWVVVVAALGGCAMYSLIAHVGYGDGGYLSGPTLLLVAPFIPGDSRYASFSGPGLAFMALGTLMALAWWYQAGQGILLIPTLIGGLAVAASYQSGMVIAANVAIVGVLSSFFFVVMGGGVQLEDLPTRQAQRSWLGVVRLAQA